NVAIVTHGGVISVLCHILLKVDWSNKKRPFPAGNTSVHTVELQNGCRGLTHRNDMKHLEADDLPEQGP
ncbi:MAG: histidine phosphatase family protein, partial [Spirochaetia bacterium]